tara:strand:- start:147 stop:335 length:189 start_codon:yes stop_codon:yes gene_type:complete
LFIDIPKIAGTPVHIGLNFYAIPKNKYLARIISPYFPMTENIKRAYFQEHPKAETVLKNSGK